MALSKNRIKYIHSLEQKKNRKADKVFLAEGPKLVGDLLGHFPCQFLLATSEWLSRNRPLSTVTCQPAENSPTSAGCVPAAG